MNNSFCRNYSAVPHEFISSNVDTEQLAAWKITLRDNRETHDCSHASSGGAGCADRYSTQAACDGDPGCAWCLSGAVPPACNTLADAKRLPPSVFKCDKVPAKSDDDDSSCPTWTEPDLYPPPKTASASVLFVVDCTAANNATKLAATTLQGVVNADERTGARVYLLLAADQASVGIAGWDSFWLETFRTRGLVPSTITTLAPEQFFVRFADSYDAIVIIDSDHLFHTINVATMIAATEERSIVVHADMVTTLGKGKRATDLRGRWNSSVAMYTWALENLYGPLL